MAAAQVSATAKCSPEALARFHAAVAEMALASRLQLEAIIQASIDMLDTLDGDADLEPSLGFLAQQDQRNVSFAYDAGADLEFQCEDEAAQCDDEGVDSDSELESADYAQDGFDQTRFAGNGDRWVSELGVR